VQVLVVQEEAVQGGLEIGWECLVDGVFGGLKYNFFCCSLFVWIMRRFHDIKISPLPSSSPTPLAAGPGGLSNTNFPLSLLLSVSVGMGCFCSGVFCPSPLLFMIAMYTLAESDD